MKVGIISQARMTSQRLPGKVMLEAANKTMLQHHVERVQVSTFPLFIATTTNQTDDCIVDLCQKLKVPTYRGDEFNVLERYYRCAKQYKLDIVVRVTSDCPLFDGKLLKEHLDHYLTNFTEDLYVSNCRLRSFPIGLDFEIFSFKTLEYTYQKAYLPEDLEHVSYYIQKNHAGEFQLKDIVNSKNQSQYRITLDEIKDYELLKILIENYQAEQLSYREIIELLETHPELSSINCSVSQKIG